LRTPTRLRGAPGIRAPGGGDGGKRLDWDPDAPRPSPPNHARGNHRKDQRNCQKGYLNVGSTRVRRPSCHFKQCASGQDERQNSEPCGDREGGDVLSARRHPGYACNDAADSKQRQQHRAGLTLGHRTPSCAASGGPYGRDREHTPDTSRLSTLTTPHVIPSPAIRATLADPQCSSFEATSVDALRWDGEPIGSSHLQVWPMDRRHHVGGLR
jgi:hypothetical protein